MLRWRRVWLWSAPEAIGVQSRHQWDQYRRLFERTPITSGYATVQVRYFCHTVDTRLISHELFALSAFVNSEGDSVAHQLFADFDQNECKFAIYVIGTIALMFCLLLTISSSVIIVKSKRSNSKWDRTSNVTYIEFIYLTLSNVTNNRVINCKTTSD